MVRAGSCEEAGPNAKEKAELTTGIINHKQRYAPRESVGLDTTSAAAATTTPTLQSPWDFVALQERSWSSAASK